MLREGSVFETIVMDVQQGGLSFDVRCFLVPHATGIVLIDTGLPGAVDLIAAGLDRLGGQWADVTDVVLTHKHFDHVANVGAVAALAGSPDVWSGAEDRAEIAFEGTIQALGQGAEVRGLRVLATPGHTPGHHSLAHDEGELLFTGDVAGSMNGVLTRGPEQFTEDADQAEETLRQVAGMSLGRLVFSHGDEVADPAGDLRRLVASNDAS